MENFVILLIVGAMTLWLVINIKEKRGKKRVCLNCKSVVRAYKKTRGSSFIELILYLFFIIPGLLYSSWRLSDRKLTCPQCDGTNVVPVGSTSGDEVLQG